MRPEIDVRDLLSIAEEAARRSGRLLAAVGEAGRAVKLSSRRDVKIAADRLSENSISKFLNKASRLPILAEESGLLSPGRRIGNLRWVVDPLDGTMNFYRGIPISCVSIGLCDDKRPVLGAVYDFNRDELFSGITDVGSWLNGRKITTSDVRQKVKAVMLTGFPSKTDFSKKAIGSFVDDIRSYKKVRLLGSAALSLAYIASGRADAYYERDIMIWDVAAGAALVMGSGGVCRMKYNSCKGTFHIYASNIYLPIAEVWSP